MSWLFSQALVAAFSEGDYWDGAQSAQLNLMPTQQPFSPNGKTMAFSTRSQFGLTLRRLSAGRGTDLLMSYLAVFRARTSAPPAREQESKASNPVFGWRWPASYAKYDHDSHSWKTRQSSLLGGLSGFSETWPKCGLMLDGECLVPTMQVLLMRESASGSWPSPRSTDADRGGRGDLIQAVRGNENSHYRLWQTPTADDAVNRTKGKVNSRGEPKLSAQVKRWPTPHGFSKDGRSNGPSGNELGRAVNLSFPTPVSTSRTGGRQGLDGGQHARQRLTEDHGEQTMKELTGGSLNPTWVEWLMGWPIEWTALKPLETAKFRQWLRSHGGH